MEPTPYFHSSLSLPPFSQSECTSRQLHFSCKHLHRHFPLPLSHQFISCRCVKDRGLGREMWFCLPSNSPESDFQTISPYQTMRLNYHIIFQHLNLLSPRLRQFHRRKMPFLNSPVPLQLHLKALLEDLGPSAVVIEMIAMLFVDTVMGQRGRDSSSNPDKGVQSFS